ncbi:MAG: hypothetical protein RBU27_07995 [Bacteroidota bacterium]|jgi:hypothetical protein|nr:hypothetical protein [Bacteroidota bacterium]
MAKMNRPKTNEQAAKFLPWYKRWLQMRRDVPVTFHIAVPSSIQESSRVTVEVSVENPDHAASERLAKLPDYFIRSQLSAAEVTKLVPLLFRIQGVTGRGMHDALALLATFQVLAMDSFLAAESIGIRGVWDAFDGVINLPATEKRKRGGGFHPVFSPLEINDVWESAVLPFLKVYTLDPLDRATRLLYDTIPPFSTGDTIPLEQLSKEDLMSDAELQRALEILRNEHRVTTDALLESRATVKDLVKFDSERPTREILYELADEHRYKSSGKINYSAIGRLLDRDHKTIKRWCEDLGIR